MIEVKQALSSPLWWISVVVAGILINLLSSYLRTILDSRFSRLSKTWRERSGKRREEHEKSIQYLTGQPHHQVMRSHYSINLRIESVAFLVMGIFMMAMLKPTGIHEFLFPIKVLVNLFASFLYFLSFWVFLKAARITYDISEAIAREEHCKGDECSNKPSGGDVQ